MSSNVPASIHLAPGERWTLRLHGLGTAGYQWVCSVEAGSDVVSASLSLLPLPESPPPGGPPPPGSNADYQLDVYAQKTGKATLRLALRRSWQPDKPAEQHLLQVEVS